MSHTLNIFIVIHDFSGCRTYADELVSYYSDRREVKVHQIFLECNEVNEFTIKEESSFTCIKIPKSIKKEYKEGYYYSAALLMYSHFHFLDNIILHCNMPEQYYFAKSFKDHFNCPVVFTFHFLESFLSYIDYINVYHKNEKKGNVLPGTIMDFADQIICVTEFARRAAINHYHVEPEKISVLYNGNQIFAKTDKETVYENKVKMGFNPQDKILLYAGQLEPRKGIDKLIKAFLLIKNEYKSLKLIIAGTGEFDSYMPLANSCIGQVHFAGKLSKKTLELIYSFSDIGILPSRYEQCSYVALEMIKHQIPLIISNAPGLNELVEHEYTGLICNVIANRETHELDIDEQDLAHQIKILLDHPDYAMDMADKAYNKGREMFSLTGMGEGTLNIYKQLLEIDKLSPSHVLTT
jgi:glycosyltransferase involved in cell wall biosynthesis